MKSWHETVTLPTNWIAQYKLASHNNATIDDVEKKLVDFARSVAIAIRSSRMEKLLAKAASISAGEFPKLVTCNWPLGKATLYDDRIVLDARVETYELLFSDIDHLQFNFLQVNIEHHNPNVIKDISVNGVRASRAIRNAIVRHRLPIKIK